MKVSLDGSCQVSLTRVDFFMAVVQLKRIHTSEYSCFERGCLKNEEKLTMEGRLTVWKVVMGNGGFTVA